MVGTVAGDGAPRSLWRCSKSAGFAPFSFFDSSLVGLRPFSLPLFHPARALRVVFVALCCLLRYWLGFYLHWPLMTTVSPSHTSRQLQLVHNHTCSKPIFTKFNRLSILVANSHNLILFRICSIFQSMEQALPSLSDGWHVCSRRCQLALDLTARGTGFTHPGRLQRGWWFCFIVRDTSHPHWDPGSSWDNCIAKSFWSGSMGPHCFWCDLGRCFSRAKPRNSIIVWSPLSWSTLVIFLRGKFYIDVPSDYLSVHLAHGIPLLGHYSL